MRATGLLREKGGGDQQSEETVSPKGWKGGEASVCEQPVRCYGGKEPKITTAERNRNCRLLGSVDAGTKPNMTESNVKRPGFRSGPSPWPGSNF